MADYRARITDESSSIRANTAAVYSVSSDEIATFTGNDSTVRSAEILDGISDVVGPVLNEAGRQIHQEYDW